MSQNILEVTTGNNFPRGFANPVRCNKFKEYYIPNSIEDLQGYIDRFEEVNCFLTVYSFRIYDQITRDKNTAIIDCLPFDFDDEACPENALEDVMKFLGWAKKNNFKPRLHYSGNKGFHIFLDINPIQLKYPQSTLKRFAFEMQDSAQFKTLDMSVIGDLDRVIRIPNTKHGKTGRYCIPIDIELIPFLTMKDIEYMARQKSDYVPERIPADESVTNTLFDIDAEIEEELKQREEEERKKAIARTKSVLKNVHVPIQCEAYPAVIKGIKSGNRDHGLVGIIHKAKKDGHSYEEIWDIIKDYGKKCEPPMPEKLMEVRLKYHMKKDYSICTFFSQFCKECITCPHNRALRK